MKKRDFENLRCFVLVSLACYTTAFAQTHNIVTLIGALKSKISYGPPGFGETPHIDARSRVFYVHLKGPVSPQILGLRQGGGADDRKTYSDIQIWCGEDFARCERFLRKNVNKQVIVSGEASYALEAGDVLPVTMTAHALDLK